MILLEDCSVLFSPSSSFFFNFIFAHYNVLDFDPRICSNYFAMRFLGYQKRSPCSIHQFYKNKFDPVDWKILTIQWPKLKLQVKQRALLPFILLYFSPWDFVKLFLFLFSLKIIFFSSKFHLFYTLIIKFKTSFVWQKIVF